ncbi:MAG: hypothetical protein WD990_14120 [Acidimicrobiia bacterium]
MNAVTRIAGSLWEASTVRRSVVDELKDDPAMADDGLIGFAVIGTVVIGLTTFEWLPTVLGPLASPLAALFAAFVLRLVSRVARHPATLAETTATVTLTSLPLLVIPVPVVGAAVGITLWLLAGIFMLQRITLARLDVAAVITLLAHALTVGAVIGVAFAVEAFV